MIVKSFQYTITDEIGIHARPAGELVKLAKEFQSAVTVQAGNKKADGRRLMALMAMGIRKGDLVAVTVEGPDEETAAEKIETFFRTNL